MQNNILKTALIGVGNMGRKYAEMITAGEVPHMKLPACHTAHLFLVEKLFIQDLFWVFLGLLF